MTSTSLRRRPRRRPLVALLCGLLMTAPSWSFAPSSFSTCGSLVQRRIDRGWHRRSLPSGLGASGGAVRDADTSSSSTIQGEAPLTPAATDATQQASSTTSNGDPARDPNYHRKRRMAVAATGLLGQGAQIYSRYLSRLWRETDPEARRQSRHGKIVASVRQLVQLLAREQQPEEPAAEAQAPPSAAQVAAAKRVQEVCQEYLELEATTDAAAIPDECAISETTAVGFTAVESAGDGPSSDTAVAATKGNQPTPTKPKKNRRSIGFGAMMGLGVAGMVFSGNYVFTGLFTLMTVLGQLEYYRMVMKTGVLPARRISILGSASMFITALVAPSLHEVCLPLFGLYTMIWFLTMRRTVSTIPEIATTFTGMFYLGYVPSFWVRIRQIGGDFPPTLAEPLLRAVTNRGQAVLPAFVLPAIHLPITSGAIFIFWTWLCIAFSDVGAYFVGKSLGRTKLGRLAPAAGEASPNKTVEGVLGGCAVSAALAVWGAWAQRWPHFVWTGAAHGVMLALCGLIGDLTASMLKRDAGLKDFGDLLPEHGGIMDRVDSYIWTAPYSWLVIAYVLPALRRHWGAP